MKKNDQYLSDLIQKVSYGNEQAFEELYYSSYQQIYAYLLSLTSNKEDAKDLLQETYIQIHHACHLYKNQGTPIAWMMRISKNLFLMKVRKEKYNTVEYTDEIDSKQFDGIKNIEDRVWLEQLFTAVNNSEREIIVMHVIAGLKFVEIADTLDLSLSTVLSKYNRAIKKLNKAVKKGGISNE